MRSELDGVTARHALGLFGPGAVAAETADAEPANDAGPAAPLLGGDHVSLLANGAVAIALLLVWLLLHHHGLGSHHHNGLLLHHHGLLLDVGDLHFGLY